MAPPPAYAQFVSAVFDGEVPGVFLSSDGFAKARNGAWSPFVDAELVSPAALTAHLGADHAAAPQLRAFLRRRQGGYYALWKADDRSWGQCPVVWVGGDVGGGAVVGRSLEEFLAVAAWGVDPFTLSALRTQPKPSKAAAFFARRRIEPIADPIAVLARAEAEYPGFGGLLAAPVVAAAAPEVPVATVPETPVPVAAAEAAAQAPKKKGGGKKKGGAPSGEAPPAEAAVAPLPPPPQATELDPEDETEDLPRAVMPPRAPSAAEAEAALAPAPGGAPVVQPVAAPAPRPAAAPASKPAAAPTEGPPPGSTEAQKKAWWKLW